MRESLNDKSISLTSSKPIDQSNAVQRTSAISKLKKFIGKKNKDDKNCGVTHKEVYYPPNVPTDESLNSVTISLSSSATEDSDDVIVSTPTTLSTFILDKSASETKTIAKGFVFSSVYEQEDFSRHTLFRNTKSSVIPFHVPISSAMYPNVSLVRSHLEFVFDQVDEEIEAEFKVSRERFNQDLHKPPRYVF